MRARIGLLVLVTGTLALLLTDSSASLASATSLPYPATLKVERGLVFSSEGPKIAWGTVLSASQMSSITMKSSGTTYRWGVWDRGEGPAIYPVRTTDGGVHWTTAGPQLATDWAGGSLYYVSRVITVSATAVVMVSNAVIDVTIDGGHHWYQYLNSASNWSIVRHAEIGGRVTIRVNPARWATLPRASYAIYVLDVAHLQWRRTYLSLS